MELPGIGMLIQMLKKSLTVEDITEEETDAIEETIKTLEELQVVGSLNSTEDMMKISGIVNDLRFKMEKRNKK